MRYLLPLLLGVALAPASASAQSWLHPDAAETPAAPATAARSPSAPAPAAAPSPENRPATRRAGQGIGLGSVHGADGGELAVISLSGRVRARAPGASGTVEVWRTMAGRDPLRIFGGMGSITSLALDPSGRRLAAGDVDGQVRVWEWETGREPIFREDQQGAVRSVRFLEGLDRLWVRARGDEEPKVVSLPRYPAQR